MFEPRAEPSGGGLDRGGYRGGHGYPLLLGLHISPYEFVADAQTAAALIDEFDPSTPLAAPSSAYWPLAGEMRPLYAEFMANGGGEAIDMVTWHYYPQQSVRCPLATRRAEPGLMLDPANLDEVAVWAAEVESVREEYARSAPVWLGESGNAQCGGEPGISDAFEGGFWWLDQLGQLARRGQPAVIRQTLSGSNYGLIDEATLTPNPDYFSSVLWRRLMGTQVLRATVSGEEPLLRAYAHCARSTAPGYRPGAVTVLLLNLDPEQIAEVGFGGVAAGDAALYELTADSLSSRVMRLNGVELTVDADGAPPPLESVSRSPEGGASQVRIEPLSYAFVVLPEAAAAACP